MNPLVDLLLREDRVIVFDGAMGTGLDGLGLRPDDFDGHLGCYEILNRTRPDSVRGLHEAFLDAGCDVIETNTFGANRISLDHRGLGPEARDLNRRAALLAQEAVRKLATPHQPRFVVGSIGSTHRLPTLGQVTFAQLLDVYGEQALGLLDGGVDGFLVETSQDILQIKAAMLAIRRVAPDHPVLVSLTLQPGGRTLLGTEVATALATLLPLHPAAFGLNCSAGPHELAPHIRALARLSPIPVSVMPNAGLPELIGDRATFPMTPQDFAEGLVPLVVEHGVRIVGGCCGTTPQHIAALVSGLAKRPPAVRKPSARAVTAMLTSLYETVPLRRPVRPLRVGERASASGSRAFRRRLLADDLDGAAALARTQEADGAHAIDLCVAATGRDEARDMVAIADRLNRVSRLPLCIDTTRHEVMEVALQHVTGRAVLNSLTLEDPDRARRILALARDYGAAVVALAIDEEGMALTAERKIAVCERVLALAVREFGLQAHDILFDFLTLALASTKGPARAAARETLDAIRQFKRRHPECLTILGISNVSYGLPEALRPIVNQVFLREAVDAGLDAAITDPSQPGVAGVDEPTVRLIEDFVLDRVGSDSGDPLATLLQRFHAPHRTPPAPVRAPATVAERLERQVFEGDLGQITILVDAAVAVHGARHVLDAILLPAMQQVGQMFEVGRMPLPFVLQAAQVMQTATQHLGPLLQGSESRRRGRIVLATVTGDVHDIGKNLVDIILRNNGFEVVNLGVRVGVDAIIRACEEQSVDAIGMSGLLVQSALVMRDNLAAMKAHGLSIPVLVGGAALSERFCREQLVPQYDGPVFHGKDAFDALRIMRDIEATADASGIGTAQGGQNAPQAGSTPRNDVPVRPPRPFTAVLSKSIKPPFQGTRLMELPAVEVLAALDEDALFVRRWQYRRGSGSDADWQALIDSEARPALAAWKDRVLKDGLLLPRAVLALLPATPREDGLAVAHTDRVVRFALPTREAGWFAAFVVTIGPGLPGRIADLFAEGSYRDYLLLHGLAVECAEAAAEVMQSRCSALLGGIPMQRRSFGFPGCPTLEAQRDLLELLDAQRIGITLTESFQMVPEYSVSAVFGPPFNEEV